MALDGRRAVINGAEERLDVNCAICLIVNEEEGGCGKAGIVELESSRSGIAVSRVGAERVVEGGSTESTLRASGSRRAGDSGGRAGGSRRSGSARRSGWASYRAGRTRWAGISCGSRRPEITLDTLSACWTGYALRSGWALAASCSGGAGCSGRASLSCRSGRSATRSGRSGD